MSGRRYIAGICLSLVVTCFASCSSREDARLEDLEKALNESQNQAEMNMNSADLACYLEDKLDELEERLRTRMSGEQLEKFNHAAVAWRAYRDAHLVLVEKLWEGGSIEPLMRNGARAQLAEQRVQLLKDLHPELPEE